jgi:mono/diheme cytochrome c family protein
MAEADSKQSLESQPRGVKMPRSTAWPIVLSLGVVMLALGVATDLSFSVVGGVLLAIGLVGWISQLLPGRGHEHEPLTAEKAAPITARLGRVEQLKPGVVGYRFQLPEKVHPVSAGIKGGIIGGLLMPIPAFIWAISSGHSIWFPVNLLAGLVLPGLPDIPREELLHQLEIFHPWGLVCGIILHVMMSIGFGLIGGVLLPTLPPIPGGPVVFGSIILPMLWSGVSHSLMTLVNPLMSQFVDWPWYVASQFVYGLATSIVILRSEKIPIAPRGPGADEGGPSIPRGWLGCLVVACLSLYGCSDKLPGKPDLNEAYKLPQDIKNFKILFAQRCAGCHGDDGTLGPGPPLNDAIYCALVSEDDLKKVIGSGRDGTLMPAWAAAAGGPLTDEQVAIITKGIKQHEWASPDSSQTVLPAAPSLMPPAGTSGNARSGEKVFAVACAECHGENGVGGTYGSLNDPAFLALTSDESLRRYIITGRSDLGMPDFASDEGRGKDFKPLTEQQVSDLVALMAQWRDKPSSD